MKTLFKSVMRTAPCASPIRASREGAGSMMNVGARFLGTEGGRIAYDDTGGNGRLVIAVPGMGDLRQQYRYLAPRLKEEGYRVVTMDVRGQGASSVHWQDYSAQAAGRDVLALVNTLQASSAIVIGNSFAAGAAAWAAYMAPRCIRGAVLIGPIVRDLPMSPWIAAMVKIGFMGPWRNGFWLKYWDSLFPTQKPADHRHYREQLRRNLSEPGRMSALRRMIGLSKEGTEAIMEKIHMPSLIVMGSKDADFPDPEKEARLLASKLRASVLMVDGAGHYPHVEMPDRVAPGIIAFLGRLA